MSSISLSYWFCFFVNFHSTHSREPGSEEYVRSWRPRCLFQESRYISSRSLQVFFNHSLTKTYIIPQCILQYWGWCLHLENHSLTLSGKRNCFLARISVSKQLSYIAAATLFPGASYQTATVVNHHCLRDHGRIYFLIITFKPLGDMTLSNSSLPSCAYSTRYLVGTK